MAADSPVIEIDQLVRTYGRTDAVDGLSLRVAPGRCYGFFGRNGAGKTTTIKCLLNLLRPTSGTVKLFGMTAWLPWLLTALVTASPQGLPADLEPASLMTTPVLLMNGTRAVSQGTGFFSRTTGIAEKIPSSFNTRPDRMVPSSDS